MNWNDDIGSLAKTWMKFLGDFGPTVKEESRELKGDIYDEEGGGKVYLDSGELRELAAACNEVADWLDKRAEAVTNAGERDSPCDSLLSM